METRVRTLLVLLLVGGLMACQLKNTHLYGSEALPAQAQATISAIGGSYEKRLSIQITSINGDSVDRLKTASFLLPPGTYQISLHADKDLRFRSPLGGPGFTKEVADGKVSISVIGGHTYIPNARVEGSQIWFFFDDKGPDYPTECLPLYQGVNSSSNPGSQLYANGKKCKL